MKKVLFLIESFTLGGAEKVLVDIVNNLDPDKYQVTVYSLFRASVYGKRYPHEMETRFNKTTRFRYLFDNRIKWISLLANYGLSKFPAKLYSLFIRDRFDVVVAFYEGAPTRLVSAAKLKRGKKIAWLHTSTELSQRRKNQASVRQEKERYAEFDKIVAVSNSVSRSFSGMFPELASKLITAYNPIDLEAVQRNAATGQPINRGQEPLLVSVGRIAEPKAYDRYLRVIRDLKNIGLDFRVWIIGGGDRSCLEAFCRENGLDNVEFLGNQPNPYPFMKVADWVVVPSQIEGLGMVVLESLVLGKAVLATDCGGIREILGASEYGVLVDNDENSLFKALVSVISGQVDKRRYERTALQRGLNFSLKERIPEIERILDA